MQLAIVVPCYNEEEVLPEAAARLTAVLRKMIAANLVDARSRIYFVDDGSKDHTWALIAELAQRNQHIAGIKLSRNRGHQNALVAGLFHAEGDAIVSIDADLQDDVEVIAEMVEKHQSGCEVVYGVRDDRSSDSFLKRFTAESYYRMLAIMGVKVVFNHADYRLLSRRAIEALREYGEVNLFLRGIIPLLGFTTTTVSYARSKRFAGESKYPFKKMLGLALNGVTSFSATPLHMITVIGLLVCGLSFGMVLWGMGIRLFTDQALPGWASTVVPIYFLGGVQLLCTGIIGEYLAKIYMEVKHRPRYIVEEMVSPPAHAANSIAQQAASHDAH